MKERPAISVCLISIAVLAPIIFTACYVPLPSRYTNVAGVEFKLEDVSQGIHQDEFLQKIGAPHERSPDDRYWLYLMSRQRRGAILLIVDGADVEYEARTGVILVEFDEDGVSKDMRQYICERKKADPVCDATSRLCAILRELETPLKPYC